MKITINNFGGDFIINRLQNAGFQAFYVGGCVRNFLMNQPVNDFDITTSAKPNQICDIFQDCKYFTTGIKHGTISIVIDNLVYEVTTFRAKEKYSDFRHPSSLEFCENIHDDLSRRDFTINALAYSKKQGIIDDFNGIYDLNNRILRTVNNPETRFKEDALRVLRGMRFCSTYGLTAEEETKKQMIICSKYLSKIAKERILNELYGILTGDYVNLVLQEFKQILFFIFPNLKIAEEKGVDLANYFDAIGKCSKNFVVRLALLFYPCKDCINELLDSLPFDRKTTQALEQFFTCLSYNYQFDEVGIKKIMRLIDKNTKFFIEVYAQVQIINQNNVNLIELFNIYDSIISSESCYCITQLAVNGDDLIKLGYVGKDIKQKLDELLNLVIENKLLNDKSTLIEYLKNHG